MAHALDAVRIAVDDPHCGGVTSPDGRRRYDAKDHIIELPRYEAHRVLGSGHPETRVYRPSFGGGWSALQAQYDAWLAAQPATAPFITYATWYRTIYGKEV